MRITEIAEAPTGSKAKSIVYNALEELSQDVGLVDEIRPFEKNVRVIANGNMVNVLFRIENQGPGAGAMSFDGFKGDMDQQDYEKEFRRGKNIADELAFLLNDKIDLEDYTIDGTEPGHRKAVNLFMVSDDFIG